MNQLLSGVYSNRINRLKYRDKPVIGKWLDKHKINSNKKIREYEVDHNVYYKSIGLITKLKTGNYKFTDQLVGCLYTVNISGWIAEIVVHLFCIIVYTMTQGICIFQS